MAKLEAFNQTQNIKFAAVTILPADASALKTVFTAGANDSIVKSLIVVSDDTAARVLDLYINNGTTDFRIGAVNIPLASGNAGAVANVDLLSGAWITGLPFDGSGKRVLPLPANYVLKVSSQSTVTAAKTITVACMAEDY